MQISETGLFNSPRGVIRLENLRGFTLLELLVTVALIGIVTTFAVISTGDQVEASFKRDVQRLVAIANLQRDEAQLLNEQRGFHVTPSGYQPMSFTGSDWKNATESRFHEFPPNSEAMLSVEGRLVEFVESEDENPIPQILFLSTGEASDFELLLMRENSPRTLVSGDIMGRLKVSDLP